MARTSDSYPSVIRGVSQQVPHDRLPGQHWEQDNLVSDPVRGLSRRHGSVQQHAKGLAGPITVGDKESASNRREHTIFVEGVEYSLLVPSTSDTATQLDPVIVVNKETRKILPIVADAPTLANLRQGVSSVCAAGKFLLMSSAQRATAYTLADNMTPTSNLHVVWVRGGANSRTFSVTVTPNGGSPVTRSYTTMASYYEGRLDTSDLNPSDPNYVKLVADRQNAYQTAVNQHIAAVARDIQPENIAAQLALQINTVWPGTAGRIGSYIHINLANVVVTAQDSGNGELMRAVSNEVTAPELVTPKHFNRKVVRIVPKTAGSLAYYLRADTVDGADFGEVVWRECPGRTITFGWMFSIAAFKNGSLHISASPSQLAASIGEPVPGFEQMSCGDQESAPLPEFLGRVITYMRMFQDRLMLVAGSTVFLSRSGDYFNFFRKSVLTLQDNDPIEVFAQGTEDDVITGGVQHDRNVILCGQRYQYVVPGREAMSPRNPYVGVQASYEGANLVQHSVAGSLLFFCQRREKRLTLQRMQPGSVADRLDAVDISSQLDGYLTGSPRQIVSMTAPGVVLIRTKEFTNGFYVYSWLDGESEGERLFDSWSRWTFAKELGVLVGITDDDSGILAVTLRDTKTGPALVLDRFTRETGPSDMPYLDSMHPAAAPTFSTNDNAYCAFDELSNQFLVGLPLSRAQELMDQFPEDIPHLWAGAGYESFVTLTSPYLRDREDKIILEARLTVSKLAISVSNSAAMLATLSYDMGKTWKPAKSWSHRVSGAWILNEQSIAEEATISVPVMKENKTYRARISSRSWLPMTVASIEWAGQAFTSRGR